MNSLGDGTYFHAEAFSIGAPFLHIEVAHASIGMHNEYFLHHRRRGRNNLRCRLLRSACLNRLFNTALATISERYRTTSRAIFAAKCLPTSAMRRKRPNYCVAANEVLCQKRTHVLQHNQRKKKDRLSPVRPVDIGSVLIWGTLLLVAQFNHQQRPARGKPL